MLDLDAFVARVWQQGVLFGRNDLPWRQTDDAYAILVSEVMLQQTQVARVLTHWKSFLALFPTLDALAASDTATVLEAWQGLGYNRRALALKHTAEICSARHEGALPQTLEGLLALPGIGQATAAGVLSFAYNEPSVYIETNVRTVFIHDLFPDQTAVSDKMLYPLVEATCSADNPRGWYYALLDYGAHLKQIVVNPSRKSAHYARQSTFIGSRRQKRAEALRQVLACPGIDDAQLFQALNEAERHAGRDTINEETYQSIVGDLVKEGFFQNENGFYRA
ncbi:MAG: adenine glycosylase [Raoultibacter sp.]